MVFRLPIGFLESLAESHHSRQPHGAEHFRMLNTTASLIFLISFTSTLVSSDVGHFHAGTEPVPESRNIQETPLWPVVKVVSDAAKISPCKKAERPPNLASWLWTRFLPYLWLLQLYNS